MAGVVRPRPHFGRSGHEVMTFNILNNNVQVRNMQAVESNPLHTFVAFVVFVLLGFLSIKYPENPTPFQVHPKTSLLSIASFLVYSLAFLVKLKFAKRVDTLMEVFGSLSLISLLLMFLPADTWESFKFIIYTLWFVGHVAFFSFRFTLKWLQRRRQQMRRRTSPLLPFTSMDLAQSLDTTRRNRDIKFRRESESN